MTTADDEFDDLEHIPTSAHYGTESEDFGDRSLGGDVTSGGQFNDDTDRMGLDDTDSGAGRRASVSIEDRYELLNQLGEGGMGVVWKARDRQLGRMVVIKRLKEGAQAGTRATEQFLKEATALASLNHENIVRVFDFGEDANGASMVMEWVDGRDLHEIVSTDGPMDASRSVEVVIEVARALECAHAQQILHRDIKPHNVLLSKNMVPKLLDFGLAQFDEPADGKPARGAFLGTMAYMAPEQYIDASRVDVRTEVWSLAGTLYYLLTGSPPRNARTGTINDIGSDVPELLRPLLASALHENPHKRPESIEAFRVELANVRTLLIGADLKRGQCLACAEVNDVNRTFCDSCGASLNEPCSGCGHTNRVWERICDGCGVALAETYAKRIDELQNEVGRISSLCTNHKFEDALAIVEQMALLEHPRMAQYAEWARGEVKSIRQSMHEWSQFEARQVDVARQHNEKADYKGALALLEQIPLPRRSDGTKELLVETAERLSRAEQLRAAIQSRSYGDTLVERRKTLEEYLTLKPNDTNAHALAQRLDQKIQAEATQQHRERLRQTKEKVGQARELVQQCKFQEALDLLDTVHADATTDDVNELRQYSRKSLERIEHFVSELFAVDDAGHWLKIGKQLLQEHPQSRQVQDALTRLRKKLAIKIGQIGGMISLATGVVAGIAATIGLLLQKMFS